MKTVDCAVCKQSFPVTDWECGLVTYFAVHKVFVCDDCLDRLIGEWKERDALKAELAEAQRYAVAESSKAHQEIVELRKEVEELSNEILRQERKLDDLRADRDRLLEAAKRASKCLLCNACPRELKAAIGGRA